MYLLGKRFHIETDHKSLVSLLGSKHMDTLPLRVLRFRLHLDRFDFSIEHVLGKHLYTPHTLSRATLRKPEDTAQEKLAELAMDACVSHLPASKGRLKEFEQCQNSDPVCSQFIKYCRTGWPSKAKLTDVFLQALGSPWKPHTLW